MMKRAVGVVVLVMLAGCGGAANKHAEYRELAHCFAHQLTARLGSPGRSREAQVERARYEVLLADEALERKGGHPEWPPRPQGC
jgi:hypothetical protein